MTIEVRDLPEAVREAAVRARASLPKFEIVPIDTTPLPAAFSAWADEFIESGELDRALREVAASDPDLAD